MIVIYSNKEIVSCNGMTHLILVHSFLLEAMELNFILCPRFHGATALALLLNNHAQISCLGDTIPTRTFDQTCSCKKPVSRCPFWRKVTAALNTDRFAECENMLPIIPRICSNGKINRMVNIVMAGGGLAFGPGVWKVASRAGKEFSRMYLSFRETVCGLQGTSVLVDGQKEMLKVKVLKSMLGKKATVRLIHLVRDPRAYYYSCKKNDPAADIQSIAREWLKIHGAVAALGRSPKHFRYLLLRHEDLCLQPQSVMAQVFSFLGVENQDVCRPPVNPDKHHMMGNRMLFSFDGTVRLDTAWQQQISTEDQDLLVKLTYPLFTASGYSHGPAAAG